jgi:hypothetical protein
VLNATDTRASAAAVAFTTGNAISIPAARAPPRGTRWELERLKSGKQATTHSSIDEIDFGGNQNSRSKPGEDFTWELVCD